MKKYKKKAIIIEALQYTGKNFKECYNFAGKSIEKETKDGIIIITLEGNHLCKKGDFIVRGIKGEFYPCKPDIFSETYEEV